MIPVALQPHLSSLSIRIYGWVLMMSISMEDEGVPRGNGQPPTDRQLLKDFGQILLGDLTVATEVKADLKFSHRDFTRLDSEATRRARKLQGAVISEFAKLRTFATAY